jgi:hypothetical protein
VRALSPLVLARVFNLLSCTSDVTHTCSQLDQKAPKKQYINLAAVWLWMQFGECIEAISVGLIVSAVRKLFAWCCARVSEESETELIAAVETSINAGT